MPGVFDKLRTTFTKKLGPLPVWAWGVVGGGGLIVLRNIRESNKGTTGDTTLGEATVVPSLSGGGALAPTTDEFGNTIFVSTPGFTIEGPEGAIGAIIDQILADSRSDVDTGGGGTFQPLPGEDLTGVLRDDGSTFDEDLLRVISDLEQAFEDALAGQTTTDTSSPAPAPAPAPTPAVPPPPPPDPCLDTASFKRYTVVSGDTMWKIATKHGLPTWTCIWALKPGRSGNPDLIFPGEVFIIPPLNCC